MRLQILTVAALVEILFVSAAFADVPANMTVQGRLTDSSGAAIADSAVSLYFKVFDAPAVGNQVWPSPASGEQHAITTDGNGLWTAHLGSSLPIPDSIFADTSLWLEIIVDNGGGQTTLPRVKLNTGPFVFRAASAQKADTALAVAGSGGAYLPLAGGTMTGPITNSGNPSITMGKGNFGQGNTNAGSNAFVAGQSGTASGTLSTVSGGFFNSATGEIAAVGGGAANAASGDYAVVVGGSSNNAAGAQSFIGGGSLDTALGSSSVVAGGSKNKTVASGGAIGGGLENTTGNGYATISGGRGNQANGFASTVGGGEYNFVTSYASNVAGGAYNSAPDSGATIGGGQNNFARGAYSVVAGGGGPTDFDSNSASGDLSTIGGGRSNVSNGALSTVSGGLLNVASGSVSTIGGGSQNMSGMDWSTVAGGNANVSDGYWSSIGGGVLNYAGDTSATIAGGYQDTASAPYSTVGGGRNNSASGWSATVSGGRDNNAAATGSFVGGGRHNDARGDFACVVGGGGSFSSDSNSASGDYSFVGAGQGNTTEGNHTVIAGGLGNSAVNSYDVVVGGSSNSSISGGHSSIVGGGSNSIASGGYSSILGGFGNVNNSTYGVIAGGDGNTADGFQRSTVGGGGNNRAGGSYSVVSGGGNDSALGYGSIVPGGAYNTARGEFSWASGFKAKANHDGAFVWADSQDTEFASTASNQFLIRAKGGVGIGTNDPDQLLHVHRGSAGAVDAHVASIGVFESDINGYLSIITPNDVERGILFGEPSSNVAGGIIYNNPGNPDGLQLRTGGNQDRVTIQNDGDVGIGTNSPNGRLHVAATDTMAGHFTSNFVNSNTKVIKAEYTGGSTVNATAVYGRARPSDGWGIGGHFIGGADAVQASVSPTGNQIYRGVYASVTGGTGINYGIWAEATGSGTNYAGWFAGNVNATGTVCASNIACPSDKRFKVNIRPVNDALSMIEQLHGVNFEWTNDAQSSRDLPPGEQLGLIAQDVKKVVPQAAVTLPDGYLGVDYARLVPLLIEAIKQQQQQMDLQDDEIQRLKAAIQP